MRRNIVTATALAIPLALSSCPADAAADPAVLAASIVTVHIKHFMYNPMLVTIHAGDRVTFVNDDDDAHTISADDKSFNSAGLDSGATWQHAFARPGTYRYFCELHPYMKATIVVLPATAPHQ